MKSGSTLSRKYQVSIPKSLRERLSWKPGQKLVFVPKGDSVLIMPAPDKESLFGIAPGINTEDYRDRDDRY